MKLIIDEVKRFIRHPKSFSHKNSLKSPATPCHRPIRADEARTQLLRKGCFKVSWLQHWWEWSAQGNGPKNLQANASESNGRVRATWVNIWRVSTFFWCFFTQLLSFYCCLYRTQTKINDLSPAKALIFMSWKVSTTNYFDNKPEISTEVRWTLCLRLTINIIDVLCR